MSSVITSSPDGDRQLREKAQEFADRQTESLRSIIDTDDAFISFALSKRNAMRVCIGKGVDEAQMLRLRVDGRVKLRTNITFDCRMDSENSYLAIDKSDFHVFPAFEGAPFYRIEFLRDPKKVPASHIQFHADREELVDLMVDKQEKSQIADLHFPTGGHRFRPCFEDVLQMLISEFGIDRRTDWRKHVVAARQEYRKTQLRAAIRDAPDVAIEYLREAGYTICWNDDSKPEPSGSTKPWKSY